MILKLKYKLQRNEHKTRQGQRLKLPEGGVDRMSIRIIDNEDKEFIIVVSEVER